MRLLRMSSLQRKLVSMVRCEAGRRHERLACPRDYE